MQGNVIVVGRRSQYSLYSDKIASFEDDGGAYDQKDAAGFIKLQVWSTHTNALCKQCTCSCICPRCQLCLPFEWG